MSETMNSSLLPPRPLGSMEPKGEFLLLPREVTLQDGRQYRFSDQEFARMVTAFKSLNRKLVIDYEHQTLATLPGHENFRSPDGTAPAAGWIGEMKSKPDGIWAGKASWTPRAAQMLKDGEYQYFSPVIFWEGEAWKSKAAELGPVALTNDPQVNGLSAVAARASHAQLQSLLQESNMDFNLKKLFAELMGLDANAPDDKFAEAARAKWGEITPAITASKNVPALEGQITALKADKSGVETRLTAAVSAHGTEVTALKAAHGAEVAALKATHATEITALKSAHDATKELLGTEIATRLEETGRIATADKPAILEQAKTAPLAVLTAFKSIKVGAVVPVGTLGISTAKGGLATIKSKHDHVSASKAFHDAPPEVQQQHVLAVQYAEKNGCTYTEAIKAVAAETAGGAAGGGGAK